MAEVGIKPPTFRSGVRGSTTRPPRSSQEESVLLHKTYEPCCEKTGLRGFPTRSYTNQAVQPQKMARGLKFPI